MNKKVSQKNKITKRLTGIVVSDKMNKTVSVKIARLKKHPLYLKRYYVDRKILADDPQSKYKVGDQVIITETKPLSKRKKFRVVGKVSKKGQVSKK